MGESESGGEVALRGDYITLAQAVKVAGLAGTGGEAKHLVRSGAVLVNGVAEFFIRAWGRYLGEYESGRRRTVAERMGFEHRLRQVPGLRVFPSMANFVYVRLPQGIDGVAVRNAVLCQHGCLIRECGNKLGSDRGYLRLAVRPADEAWRLVSALREAVEVPCFADNGVAVT